MIRRVGFWIFVTFPIWVLAIAFVVAMNVGPAPTLRIPQGVDRTERVQEDDPGWDCRTMGNLVCGRDGR